MDAESQQPGRQAPLPPVTTRWERPRRNGAASGAPLPPFFAGGNESAPATMLDPVPSLETPALEEPAFETPAFETPPLEAPVVPTPPARDPNEPVMPWEEHLFMEATPAAGPAVTAESDAEASVPRDLDDWESGIDENGGQAVPAYGDEQAVEHDAFSPPPQLNDEGAVMPEPERADQSFPLDAFIIPPDAKRLPKGLEHAEEVQLEVAEELARRLEAIAQRLRREGFTGLLHPDTNQEPVDTLIAGVLAGYLSQRV